MKLSSEFKQGFFGCVCAMAIGATLCFLLIATYNIAYDNGFYAAKDSAYIDGYNDGYHRIKVKKSNPLKKP